jgi:hypothetical protein
MHWKLNRMLSGGFVEASWEPLIALATAAGTCVSIISLATHLNEMHAVRSAGEPSIATASVAGLNGAADLKPQLSSTFMVATASRHQSGGYSNEED